MNHQIYLRKVQNNSLSWDYRVDGSWPFLIEFRLHNFCSINWFPLEVKGFLTITFPLVPILSVDTVTLYYDSSPWETGKHLPWALFKNTFEFLHFNRLPCVNGMTINSSVGVLQRRGVRAKMSCPWLFVQRLGLWSGLCLRWAQTLQQLPGSAVGGKVWQCTALP